MFTRAIVCPPAPNFSQGLTRSGLGAPDYERALRQHQAYCAALEQCGLTLTKLEANPDYPDSTFVEDTALLVEGQEGDTTRSARLAILTRPGAPSRAGEVVTIRKLLNEVFPALFSIQSPGTLDGGDVCQAENHFFIGISERTNEAGARQLAEFLVSQGFTTSFVDIRKSDPGVSPATHSPDARATSDLLHLKSGLAYLGENRLAVTDELCERVEFAGYDVIRVPSSEEYGANCIRVKDHVLVAAGHPQFEGRLRELGYQTIALEMSEFQKMDGGLSCLSLRF
jgi:dimethylargininase